MVALALADRPLTRRMMLAGALSVDYFETSGPLAANIESVIRNQPFLLHNSVWNWSLAHPAALDQANVLPITRERLRTLNVPWLSVHLGFSTAEVHFDGRMYPSTAPLACDALLDALSTNLRALASQIDVPLLIENLDYNPGGAYDCLCEPDFIAAVLANTGVGFLLDIAHARVSASHLGMAIEDYLARLPLDTIRQIHVSGPRWQGDLLTDSHDTLLDEDYALLKSVLAHARPWALTLEYDRDPALVIDQLGKLRRVLEESCQ
jgi:uncharacterized protein (UPF0276 family)